MNIPKQRLAVVTGGSAGIGEAICRQLLDAGWAVVSMARRAPSFTHEHLHSIEVDLADRTATAQAADEAAHRFAPDTVIHNAGVILPALLQDVKVFQEIDKKLKKSHHLFFFNCSCITRSSFLPVFKSSPCKV